MTWLRQTLVILCSSDTRVPFLRVKEHPRALSILILKHRLQLTNTAQYLLVLKGDKNGIITTSSIFLLLYSSPADRPAAAVVAVELLGINAFSTSMTNAVHEQP